MSVHVVTFATHKEGTFEYIVNNKYNIPVVVLGYGEKWTGFRMKLEYMYNYIKDLPETDIVFFFRWI